MGKYMLRRLVRSMITLFLVVFIVFSLLRLMPIEGYFPNYEKLTVEQIEAGLKNMGLLDPLPIQFFRYVKDMLHGDLGYSRTYMANVLVTDILKQKIPISMKFGLSTLFLALLISIPLSLAMASHKGKLIDRIGTLFLVILQAVPYAVYLLLIQAIGTEKLHIKMLYHANDVTTWILPIVSMSLGNIAFYTTWLRRYLIEEEKKDYVILAKVKGVSSKRILKKHMLKNAIVPMIQYLPNSIFNTIIGSIYVESLYSIPGMGGLLVQVIQRQDNSMVQAVVVLFAITGILGVLLGDILLCLIDPRVKLNSKGGV
ncbi:ABC transporter permease [Lachnoclostridium phytofermentans]|uniref:ABC transporter permease n=1 Tax=Lachnoclostridium phytofermentans TaxID=66219 RepID=UPI0004956F3B|nr:ABC transporter permease [Lachnoclostridium phytofermentans]